MRSLIRICQIAGNLLTCFDIADKREVAHLLIAILWLHLAVIQTAGINTRWRTCLKAHQLHAVLQQRSRKLLCTAQTVRTAFIINLAVNNTAAQISTGSQDNALRLENLAGFGLYANNRTIFHQQLINHQLLQLQVLLILDNLFHQSVIKRLILLTAQSMHGIALTGIQKTHLDTRQIRTDTHLAAQSIKLTHQMSLSRTADRRIARHQRHIIQRQRRQQRLAAQAGSSQRCLHACVAGANDNYIKCICNITHLNRPLKNICISERTTKFFIAERYVNCNAPPSASLRSAPSPRGRQEGS